MKTDNVIIQSMDDVDLVKLIDLDLVHALDEGETERTMVRIASGTPEYMAPEVIRGEKLTARI